MDQKGVRAKEGRHTAEAWMKEAGVLGSFSEVRRVGSRSTAADKQVRCRLKEVEAAEHLVQARVMPMLVDDVDVGCVPKRPVEMGEVFA